LKRLAIFAHFDKDEIIDDYVIDYIKELKKYCEIIFVSDNNLGDYELKKIKEYCLDIISCKHGEYDFGSYKRGFELIQKKYPSKFDEIDELLLVNDSCYLVRSLEKIFFDMEKVNVDYWGLTDDYDHFEEDYKYYIGSYFISLRKSVFTSNIFKSFILGVEKCQNHDQIVLKYEIGLSYLLNKNNKKGLCYFSRENIATYMAKNHITLYLEIRKILTQSTSLSQRYINTYLQKIFNITTINYLHSDKLYFLFKQDFPLLKRRVVNKNFFEENHLLSLWKDVIISKNTKLINQIKDNCTRIGVDLKNKSDIKKKNHYQICLTLFNEKFPLIKIRNEKFPLIKIRNEKFPLIKIIKYYKNDATVKSFRFFIFGLKIYKQKFSFYIFGIRVFKVFRSKFNTYNKNG